MQTRSSQLYETDFQLWLEQTAVALSSEDFRAVDVENLVEELRDMGCKSKRELVSRLKVLLMHLLKWQFQPQRRSGSWLNTIDEQRDQLRLMLQDSPSLNPYLRLVLPDVYPKAVRAAVNETGLSASMFPLDCPYSVEQVLAVAFLPE